MSVNLTTIAINSVFDSQVIVTLDHYIHHCGDKAPAACHQAGDIQCC